MPTNDKSATQPQRPSSADLHGQYRPIGIGAVAAALSAGGKQGEPASTAANSNERTVERESLAA
jgi:hypothetical protein